MFDPTKDAMFHKQPNRENSDENIAFIRSAWADQMNTTKIHQDVQSIIQSKFDLEGGWYLSGLTF